MSFDRATYEERNFKLIKMILDHYGASFFRGKKVLDLGCGQGEMANSLAKLGAEVIAVDARQENLDVIKKKYPHVHTERVDLDVAFPFQNHHFDVVLSLGIICHIANYEKHIDDIFSTDAEHIIIETEVLDNKGVETFVRIEESKAIEDLSFNGKGCIISADTLQNKISVSGGRFKRIDETKINTSHFKYDWKESNIGRKYGNRRLWFVRRDRHMSQLFLAKQKVAAAEMFLAGKPSPTIPIKNIALCFYGEFNVEDVIIDQSILKSYDIFIHSFNQDHNSELEKLFTPLAISNETIDDTSILIRDAFSIKECNRLKLIAENMAQDFYKTVIFKKITNPLIISHSMVKDHSVHFRDDNDLATSSFVADIYSNLYDNLYLRQNVDKICLNEESKKYLSDFDIKII
jgi:SAM-dependent methyltransferase